MADRKLLLDILARDKASRPIRAVGDAAEDAAKDLEHAQRAADEAGAEMERTAKSAKTLDDKIGQASKRTRELASEMADLDQGSDAFKQLNKEFNSTNRQLSQLTRLRKSLGEVKVEPKVEPKVDRNRLQRLGSALADGIGAAIKGGKAIGEGISGALDAAGPYVKAGAITLAVAVGAVLAPAIGAAVTSGVLLAVGGGVLAAGIASAAKSAKVKSAFKSFGDEAKKVFADFGKPFEGPLVRAAATFRSALKGMAPEINGIGKSFAPIIDKLAPALTGMFKNMLPGIKGAVEASKPLFDTLAKHLPLIGKAISNFLGSISKAAPEAAVFFDDLLYVIEGAIIVTGQFIGWLSRMYVAARDAALNVTSAFAGMTAGALGALSKLAGGVGMLAGKVPGIGKSVKRATDSFQKFAAGAIGDLNRTQSRINAMKGKKVDMKANTAGANSALSRLRGNIASVRGKTVTISVNTHYRMFGKPGTSVGGIGGSGFKGLSKGGPIKGPGPRGVDSVPIIGAPGEGMLNLKGMKAIGGEKGLDALNRGLPVGAPGPVGRAAAGGRSSGGGEIPTILLGGDREIAMLFRRIARTQGVNLVVA